MSLLRFNGGIAPDALLLAIQPCSSVVRRHVARMSCGMKDNVVQQQSYSTAVATLKVIPRCPWLVMCTCLYVTWVCHLQSYPMLFGVRDFPATGTALVSVRTRLAALKSRYPKPCQVAKRTPGLPRLRSSGPTFSTPRSRQFDGGHCMGEPP